jgi:hypothetical protein
MNYFIVMVDYGRDTSKVHGLEAVVSPEMTRRGAIEKIREVLGDGNEIAFVHEVNDFGDGDMMISNVTDELVEAANVLRLQAAE